MAGLAPELSRDVCRLARGNPGHGGLLARRSPVMIKFRLHTLQIVQPGKLLGFDGDIQGGSYA